MENKTFTLITHDDNGKPVEKTISIKARTYFDKTFGECPHNQVIIDEDLWSVECSTCGEKMDPIRFLIRLAHDETRQELRTKKLINEYKRIIDILAIKTKTRCEHCGKITTINTDVDIKQLGLLLRYVDTKKNQELNKKSRTRCGQNDEGIGLDEHEFYLLRETSENKIYVCKYCGEVIITEDTENAQRI
jgi:ribosomal protein S27E